MLDALVQHLPEACWSEPSGGLYLWVELPTDGPSATELFMEAVRMGVGFAMGPLFYTDAQGAYHLRLNIAAQDADQIQEGIQRLGNAWHKLAAGYAAPDRDTVPFL